MAQRHLIASSVAGLRVGETVLITFDREYCHDGGLEAKAIEPLTLEVTVQTKILSPSSFKQYQVEVLGQQALLSCCVGGEIDLIIN